MIKVEQGKDAGRERVGNDPSDQRDNGRR
jgi:hypothetical protein